MFLLQTIAAFPLLGTKMPTRNCNEKNVAQDLSSEESPPIILLQKEPIRKSQAAKGAFLFCLSPARVIVSFKDVQNTVRETMAYIFPTAQDRSMSSFLSCFFRIL